VISKVRRMNSISRTQTTPLFNNSWGHCVYNAERRLCFVLIHKNASTTFKRLAIDKGWQYNNYYDIDKDVDRYIVILRDPADRLLSTTNMLLTYGRGILHRTILLPDKFYTEECHYEKQYKFIQGLNHIKVDFYYHTVNVIQTISNDYELGFDEIPRLNSTGKLFNSVDEDLTKKIYKEDYELIETVKFKNR
jgi:hypothetical protein